VAVTAAVFPSLIATFGADQSQLGSAIGLNAFWALGKSTVVPIAVAVATCPLQAVSCAIDYLQGM